MKPYRFGLPKSLRQPLPVIWEKLTHPLVWPVDFGSTQKVMESVRTYYDQQEEVNDYTEAVEEGLEEAEQMLVQGPMAQRGTVLDVGCGAGREAIALTELGYSVLGIDLSARMVEAAQAHARQRGLAIRFMRLAAHEVTPQLGCFDYILTTPSFYTFIPTPSLRIQTLQALKGALAPSGLLFLSAPWIGTDYQLGPRAHLVKLLRRFRRMISSKPMETELGDVMTTRQGRSSKLALFGHLFERPQQVVAEIREAGMTEEHLSEGTWILRSV